MSQQQQVKAEGATPPSPETLALAKFMRYNSELKNRVGVLNGKRVEYCKGIAPNPALPFIHAVLF